MKLLSIISLLLLVSCGRSFVKSNETQKNFDEKSLVLEDKKPVKTVHILEPDNSTDHSRSDVVSLDNKNYILNLSAREQEIISDYCYSTLETLPGKIQRKKLRDACAKVQKFKGCASHENRPIFHYDKASEKEDGFNILVFGLIHGDEFASGSVARAWMERLEEIAPRSNWRIIPVANPDGLKYRWRPNARKVDINRNFPTKNWDKLAINMWKKRYKSTWRKFPGESPASENETKCLIDHITEFKPNFIISVHTPLGHLDFDGPKLKYPKFNLLPWKKFGHYPGSLGRYMWRDNKVPVLTIELKGGSPIKSFKELDNLQDISGSLAIKAIKEIKSDNDKKSE